MKHQIQIALIPAQFRVFPNSYPAVVGFGGSPTRKLNVVFIFLLICHVIVVYFSLCFLQWMSFRVSTNFDPHEFLL